MRLRKLLDGVNYGAAFGDAEIASLSADSRKVTAGGLFFCLKGGGADGHGYYAEAEKNGAAALVCERKLPSKLPQIIVGDCREAMARIAGNFYLNPVRGMKLITVTGTNGKTTTSFIIREIGRAAGFKTGLIGSAGVHIDGRETVKTDMTTPDPIEMHRVFGDMRDEGVQWVAMEVSAHAIELRKTAGLTADAACFTNLSRDHLDFFKTMEAYGEAKAGYFTTENARAAAINVDDAHGREILSKTKIAKRVTYGTENPADVFGLDLKQSERGLSFMLNSLDDTALVRCKLPGRHNMYNALCAAAAARALGVPVKAVAAGIERLEGVPGRFTVVPCGGFTAIIDFAHTPDGLEKALKSVKEFARGRVITVFGCGGNRDAGKRFEMGRVSAENSSLTVITSDNPRFENPAEITREIERGVLSVAGAEYAVIENRGEAISYAVGAAKKRDVVLIAGKGCEDYQEINGVKRPYNDLEFVKELINGRGRGAV